MAKIYDIVDICQITPSSYTLWSSKGSEEIRGLSLWHTIRCHSALAPCHQQTQRDYSTTSKTINRVLLKMYIFYEIKFFPTSSPACYTIFTYILRYANWFQNLCNNRHWRKKKKVRFFEEAGNWFRAFLQIFFLSLFLQIRLHFSSFSICLYTIFSIISFEMKINEK